MSENPCQIIINPNYKAEWREGIDHDDYHADKTTVNSTSAKAILESPHAFKHLFIDGHHKEPSDAMRLGNLIHFAMLDGNKFKERYVIMPEFVGPTLKGEMSAQSKVAKEKRAAWVAEQEAQEKFIITQDELDKLLWVMDSVLKNEDALKILRDGVAEMSGYYPDPETGIVCRIRPDFYSVKWNAEVDVKSVMSTDIDWFRRWRVEDDSFMYFFQKAMYAEGTKIINGKQLDFSAWLLVQNEHPFESVLIPMEDVFQEIGAKLYHRSLRLIKQSIETRSWPRKKGLDSMFPSTWFLEKYKDLI